MPRPRDDEGMAHLLKGGVQHRDHRGLRYIGVLADRLLDLDLAGKRAARLVYAGRKASCSRALNSLRPAAFVPRQARSAKARNDFSASESAAVSRSSSSQPFFFAQWVSICRASLSPIGLDDLTWLHMLGETCSFAAKDCSRPLGGEPLASSRSAYSWNSASALRLRVRVMFDTGCLRGATDSTPFSQGVDRGVKTLYSLARLPDPGFVFLSQRLHRDIAPHRPNTPTHDGSGRVRSCRGDEVARRVWRRLASGLSVGLAEPVPGNPA
jgi:hypothetical protein